MTKENRGPLEISVLLSCYNSARWLEDAITSVLDQTYKDFEFIIVDDGSTDNSPEIIKRYSERDDRILVISKSNSGLADSLNLGIQKASGTWIARIDADDVCEPDRLEVQLAEARGDPDLVFIGSGLRLIDEFGSALKVFRYPFDHRSLVKNLHTARRFPPHSSAFYRADTVRAIGGYRAKIRRAEDRDLWLRLSEVGKLTSLDQPLVLIRMHPNQISRDESGKRQKIDSTVAITSYLIRRNGLADPVAADGETFESFYAWIANRLEQNLSFEFYEYEASLRTNIARVLKSPFCLWSTLATVARKPGFLIRFFIVRLFGDSTPHRLADEWKAKRDIQSES